MRWNRWYRELSLLDREVVFIQQGELLSRENAADGRQVIRVCLSLVSRAVNSFLFIAVLLAPGFVAAPQLRPC